MMFQVGDIVKPKNNNHFRKGEKWALIWGISPDGFAHLSIGETCPCESLEPVKRGDNMFKVGDVVQYKHGKKFVGGRCTAKIEYICNNEVHFNTGTWMFSSQAEQLLEIVKRGNNMNERSAELLERVAQLVREGKNPCDYFQYYCPFEENWNTLKFKVDLMNYIFERPGFVREKPQTMNLGGYEIPMPIQKEPVVGAKVFFPDINLGSVGDCIYAKSSSVSNMFHANLLHYDYQSAQDHLDVLKKLHGVE